MVCHRAHILRHGNLPRYRRHFFGTGFAAEVTFRNGYVEKQHGFLSQAGALDWVGERLVEDQDPAREA